MIIFLNVHRHTCKFQTLKLILVNLTNSVIAVNKPYLPYYKVFIKKRSSHLVNAMCNGDPVSLQPSFRAYGL